MATDIPKQVILIKDLPTKSVILYPSRAHITRDINNVILKPGPNEVEIYGITPTADEHSVQIEGKGVATITDMTVELVPNKDIFEEVYPGEDEASDSSEDESDDEDEVEAAKEIRKEIAALEERVQNASEARDAATKRLEILNSYSSTANATNTKADDMRKLFELYRDERSESYAQHVQAQGQIQDLQKQIQQKARELAAAEKEDNKRKQKLLKQKEKVNAKKIRQMAERRKEAQRIKEERLKFWPKKVYRVILHLETSSMDTPASSRRGSIDSVTLAYEPTASSGEADADKGPNKQSSNAADTTVSLSLSYVTREASWSPRYDLSLSSITKSGTIVYRAEFTNTTSETWKDAKVSLSTSQTSYSGLDDTVPFMHAWRVTLGKYERKDGGLLSTEEMNKPRTRNAVAPFVNRRDLFGVDWGFAPAPPQKFMPPAPRTAIPFGSNSAAATAPAPAPPGNLFSNPALSLQTAQQPQARQFSGGLMAAQPTGFGNAQASFQQEEFSVKAERSMDIEYSSQAPLEFEESKWEDNGLTATYDIPNPRTIPPSSTARRHKIASLTATKIHMSYISVPKLRAAAFLRAKLRNPSSSITLLKGQAGVTLDGSFLGTMPLPRVGPGQAFELPLGVDPGIHVSYPKPGVRRSTQGIFTKESAQVYTRSMWITNTKGTPVEMLVLDQVPVSEDDRLKIEVLAPKGLAREGDSVRAGVAAKEGSAGATASSLAEGKQSANWGKAVATLKKDGEVAWAVNLEKGMACLLKLEYEARLPSAEKIVQV